MASPSDTTHHFLADKRIIISGAGISGLAFAYSLHKLWPSTSPSPPPSLTLYERDPCVVPKNREGYSLSLRSDQPSAGIQTLQKMGLLDRMLNVSITSLGGEHGGEGEGKGAFCIWDKNFTTVMKIRGKTPKGCPVAAMRITRANLRRTLVEAVESLPNVSLHWGEAITSVSTTETGHVRIETDKNVEEDCDILIAADGSSSKLRMLLRPQDRLTFAGPTCIHGTIPISGHHPSSSSSEFGTVVSGAGPALFIAPIDDKEMIWSLSRYVDEPPVPLKHPLSAADSQALLDEAKKIGVPVYCEKFGKIIQDTDPKSLTRFNAMDKQPFAHTGRYVTAPDLRDLNGKVIFIGDANHAVSPFAGNGANLALTDGYDLAESLVQCSSLKEAVKKYDKLAVGRAKKVISTSHFTIMLMHSSGWMSWAWMKVLRVILWLFYVTN